MLKSCSVEGRSRFLSPVKMNIGGLRQIAVSRAISSKTVLHFTSSQCTVPVNAITNILKWTNCDQLSGHSIRINLVNKANLVHNFS
jgi:hypothetical protein